MRKKIGIVIDYSIRIPDFKGCYSKCKSEIISGAMSADGIDQSAPSKKDDSGRDFWIGLSKKGGEEYLFYETSIVPQENFGDTFDYTLRKYFYNDEHRLRFLDDWSFNLYGQGLITNSADVSMINICQSKVCDVILIDRATHARKIPNTLSYLSKSQLFVKGIQFVNKIEDLKEMEESGEFVKIYDPIQNPALALFPGRTKIGEPSGVFVDWLMKVEKELRSK